MSKEIIRFSSVHLTVDSTLEAPHATSLPEYLRSAGLVDQPQEVFWVASYDAVQRIRTIVEVARGSYHEVNVHIPTILAVPLMSGTDRFSIAHNHPAGGVVPTELDVDLTNKVQLAAAAAGLILEDHFIIASTGGWLSMERSGYYAAPSLRAAAASHKIGRKGK